MEFRKIEYFLKAAETLSFTEAAKQLYISPQALSQQIAGLEAELGCRLFTRSTRRISLTEAGQFCYLKFAPLKASFDQTVTEVTHHLSAQSQTLRIGFFNALPKQDIVNPWLNLILADHPAMETEIISTDLDTIWKYLEEGKLDLVLTNVDSYFLLENYDYCVIQQTPARIITSLLHPWVLKETVTAKDMADADMLQFKSSYNEREPQSFYTSVTCHDILRVSDFDTMLAMLETGKYYAVFPDTFAYHDQAKFRYFPLPKEYDFQFLTICATRKHGDKPIVSEIMDNLRKSY